MRSREPQIIESGQTILSDDDSEIDEDEAFNSEDELMYGEFFLSSKRKKKSGGSSSKGSRGKDGEKGGGGDSDDDESSDEEDDVSDDESNSESDGSDDEHDWAGSDDDSDDDEEDDGGQYMLDLLNNLDKQVPSSAKKNDKKESSGGKISLSNNIAAEAAVHLTEGEYASGALSAMGSNNTTTSGSAGGKLTLDSLMGGISDTAGFSSVQKSMRALSSGSGGKGTTSVGDGSSSKKIETTAVPLSRVISERTSRKVHYEATTSEVSRWKDAIHEQRDAETLDFRTNAGGARVNRVTRDTLVDKFVATNDFEREIQEALEKAGVEDERALAKKERKRLTGHEDDVGGEANATAGFSSDDEDNDTNNAIQQDDLGSNHITLAEYKKRHGELAKLRALMFYEEQKRHRINKIKSKKYRKIRKRQRDRLKDAEDEAAKAEGGAEADMLERERIEREEMDRMKERMTLAHKNTSKWAKRVLRRGAKMDMEERKALSLQIAKGEELRRKVLGHDHNNDEDSDDEETEESLLKKARDILMENDDDNEEGKGKKKGLFQLEFMKRGMEQQRKRAKEEARKLLEELEANEAACRVSSDDDSSSSDDEEKKKSNKKKKDRVATEAETKQVLPEGKLVASSLQFGKADGFAIKVDGNIELDGTKKQKNDALEENQAAADSSDDEHSDNEEADGQKIKRKKKRNRRKKKDQDAPNVEEEEEEEEENPWISTNSSSKSSGSKKAKSTKPLSRTVNITEAASMLVDTAQDKEKDKSSVGGKRKRKEGGDTTEMEKSNDKANGDAAEGVDKKDASAVGIAELSQAELVRRAFAAPADLEAAEEEFQKEKERMKERDDPTRKKKEEKIVSGWGSWAGVGAPPPKKPRKLPPKLRAPQSKKTENNKTVKRKDDGMSTVIINEKRLKKTSKFQLSEIPYPYRTREEYERAISGNIGQEWNTMHGTKEMSRPAVLVRAGKIIQPIGKKSKSKQQMRAPAKF